MGNQITVNGRLGKDAELRYTTNQKAVSGFSLASDVGWGDNKTTLWFNCSIWGERGEKLLPYLTKGAAVVVLGELSERIWQDKEGNDRKSLEVNVRDIWLVGGKKDGEGSSQNSGGSSRAAGRPSRPANGARPARAANPGLQAAAPAGDVTFDDDDIPF